MRRRDLLKAIPLLMTPALARADTLPLRFIPNANLTSLDPIWTTALVAQAHGYLVYDTLYGIDASNKLQPQMCAGHDVSADELTWTFTLRDGLAFHDGEKVLAKDCVMSLKRWASRNSFGQQLTRVANEIVALDDRRFQIRLKKPFRQMLYGLGARSCFMMPERMAKTPASEQVKETIGSGPFRFLPGEWVSGARAGYARFDGYVPRQEPPSFYAGGKVAHFERVEWIVQPDSATAAAALQKGEVDWVEQPLIDLCPMLRTVARRAGRGERSLRMAADHRAQSPDHAVRQSEAAARAAAGARPESLCHGGDRRAGRTRPRAGRLFRRRPTDGDARRARGADPAARYSSGEATGGRGRISRRTGRVAVGQRSAGLQRRCLR